jgi:uncharacterized membrane protein
MRGSSLLAFAVSFLLETPGAALAQGCLPGLDPACTRTTAPAPPPHGAPRPAPEPPPEPAAAPGLEDRSRQFTFDVCNESPRPGAVVIAGRIPEAPSEWFLRGWWIVYLGSCRHIGAFMPGAFYVAAVDQHGGWFGNAYSVCVPHARFQLSIEEPQPCVPGATRLVRFQELQVNPGRFVWRMH